MSESMLIRPVIAALAITLGGCGSKDNVALSGSISDVAIAREQLTLGTRLSGGFRLHLELGEHAPAAVEVDLGSFSLLAADQSEVERLMVLDPTGAFPMSLDPGQSRSAELTLDDTNPIAGDPARICESLRLAGVVQEAGGGRSTTVSSPSFTPDGC